MLNTIEKQWGREVILCSEENYAAKLLVVTAGKISSLHCHLTKDETFIVVSGDGWFQKRDLVHRVFEGDRLRVIAGEYHRFWSEDGMTLLEISTRDVPEDNERKTLSGDILQATEKVDEPFDGHAASAILDLQEYADTATRPQKNVIFDE